MVRAMATGHHTKDKGDLAVVKVHADLVEKGAVVLVPLTEHAPFDLVAYLDTSFYRVQVKYRRLTRGSVNVEFMSTWADRHGIHKRPMPRDQVDVVAIYCPDTRDTYYINPGDFRGSVTLRVTPPRNGQHVGVLPVSQYLTMPPVTTRGMQPGQPALDINP
jgi:hypothetical protein